MDSEEIQDHSDCGTFNETVNEKRLHLTEEQQEEVNAILEKHIKLGDTVCEITHEQIEIVPFLFEELDVDYTTNNDGTYACRGNIFKFKIEVSGIEGESD